MIEIATEVDDKILIEIDEKIVAEIEERIVVEIEAKKEIDKKIIAISIVMKVMIQLAMKNHLIFGWLKII